MENVGDNPLVSRRFRKEKIMPGEEFVEYIPKPILVIDAESGTILQCNQLASRDFETPIESLLYRPITDICPGISDLNEWKRWVCSVKKTGTLERNETFQNFDGSTFEACVKATYRKLSGKGYIFALVRQKSLYDQNIESIARDSLLLQLVPYVVIETDFTLAVENLNLAAMEFFENRAIDLTEVFSEAFLDRIRNLVETGQELKETIEHRGKFVQWSVIPVLLLKKVYFYGNDVTETILLKQKMEHRDRLEEIGRLAGGIAHDFNNVLATMKGEIELAKQGEAGLEDLRRSLHVMEKGVDHAAGLCHQILTYCRQQASHPRRVDLCRETRELMNMLMSSVRENITLNYTCGDRECYECKICDGVFLDPSQYQQLLMNLVINSRDAIDDTGRIVVKTEYVEVKEGSGIDCFDSKLNPGEYCRITISDDGCGMDETTLKKLFNPFYTTKKSGTGLGLSVVYGIVRQNNGHIRVKSELGRGSTFEIYFPLMKNMDKGKGETTEQAYSHITPGYGCSIEGFNLLVVEDNEDLANVIRAMLKKLGARVELAHSVEEGKKLINSQRKFDILLTDVILTDGSGKDMVAAAVNVSNEIVVVYMSGYPADELGKNGIMDSELLFIQKPFTLKSLERILKTAVMKKISRKA